MESLDNLIRAQVAEVYAQRDEIMRAFIAKYGFEPDRAIQVHEQGLNGKWYVRRMDDEEWARARQLKYPKSLT